MLFCLLLVGTVTCASLDDRLRAFNEWLSPKLPEAKNAIKAVVDADLRLGTVATRDIAREEIYNAVPVEWTISFDAIDDELKRVLKAAQRELRVSVRDVKAAALALYVASEAARGDASRWQPYLALLPALADYAARAPYFFDEHAMALLGNSWIVDDVRREVARDAHEYSTLRGLLARYRSTFAVPPLKRYLWAMQVLNSRSIWWSGERHLVPLLDLINCRDVGGRPHTTTLTADARFAETRAATPFKAGEQVTEDYGQSNEIYFRFHGFYLDVNRHDSARLTLSVPRNIAYRAERLAALQQRPTRSFFIAPLDRASLHAPLQFLFVARVARSVHEIQTRRSSVPKEADAECRRLLVAAASRLRESFIDAIEKRGDTAHEQQQGGNESQRIAALSFSTNRVSFLERLISWLADESLEKQQKEEL